MKTIQSIEALEDLYGPAVPRSLTKVVQELTPLYRRWIDAARFAILTSVGEEGTDASPRGDDGPVVRVVDDKTVWLPDWRGNNRIDSLRNIVRDGRVSLMFMVPGEDNVVRINGVAALTADPTVTETFVQNGKSPKTVIVVTVGEVYFQCAKALMRSGLWGDTPKPGLPSAGDFIKEREPAFDGKEYDSGYSEYAKTRMW
ncbi:MAG: pyridoxamine 5'-phosphate oxidase family protein [Pseudomonadota bacterium]